MDIFDKGCWRWTCQTGDNEEDFREGLLMLWRRMCFMLVWQKSKLGLGWKGGIGCAVVTPEANSRKRWEKKVYMVINQNHYIRLNLLQTIWQTCICVYISWKISITYFKAWFKLTLACVHCLQLLPIVSLLFWLYNEASIFKILNLVADRFTAKANLTGSQYEDRQCHCSIAIYYAVCIYFILIRYRKSSFFKC